MSAEEVEKIVEGSDTAGAGVNDEAPSMILSVINDIIYSPINLGLVLIIAFLVYKIIKDRFEVPSDGSQNPPEPVLPKLRRDFTVEELREFDQKQPDGRVLVAVNGKVFDVTKGKRFYGPGGPYHMFAGRDVSRNLATFSVAVSDNTEYDDLSDLTPMEMDSVLEWEEQFKEKYEYVGKLLRKGEQPTNYDDEEDETTTDEKTNAKQPADEDQSLRNREAQKNKGDDTALPKDGQDDKEEDGKTKPATDEDQSLRNRETEKEKTT